MAFRRKRIKDENGQFITEPRACYVCKEKKAFWKMLGGAIGHYKNYGGKLLCDDCYPVVKKENDLLDAKERNYHMTEADYQTWDRL